jgi:riboflavin synthase
VFTGIVQAIGRVERVDRSPEGVRIAVATPLAAELGLGDSVAVDGVCLTAAEAEAASFVAEVMNETLHKTSLNEVEAGAEVNLELPLRASDRLGGHVVQGHVDAVGTVAAVDEDGFARRVRIDAPEEVRRYLVEKGSVAVDGVSLTVIAVEEGSFEVSLIPETLERTGLGRAEPGTKVNLEVDMIAKYVEKAVRGAAYGLGREHDRHNHAQPPAETPEPPARPEARTMEGAG